jgi:SSS family solute:Na+ symporter
MYFLKRITYLIGTLATCMSVGLLYQDFKSLQDFFTEALGVFAGASMGLFFLGIFSKRANAQGALTGVIVTVIVMYVIVFISPLNFWLYSAIGLITCYTTGLIFSLLSSKPAKFQGLSIWSTNTNIIPK